MKQLALTVGLATANTFANYYINPENKIAVNTLRQLALGGAGPVVGIQASAGVGKSHLLQACCASVSDSAAAACFSMADLMQLPPAQVLENLDALQLIAIDDIDLAFGDRQWEEALFHFYNRLIDGGSSMLFSVSKPLKSYVDVLPDLLSRLTLALVFSLKPLDDEQLLAMLVMRARELGITVSDDVAAYVFKHCERTPAALISFLKQLDQLSLSARRKPSVPLVKTLLAQLAAPSLS